MCWGGDVLSFEPIPSTYRRLKKNISVNGLDEHVEALNVGVGPKPGKLRFSADADTVNHVVSDGELINSMLGCMMLLLLLLC
jgi:FkbM family methyltransferase